MKVIVIGAGVVGLGAAWELSRRGADVVVLERDRPGAGATMRAAGMLAAAAEARYGERSLTRLSLESLASWPQFARELSEASEIDVGYRDEGTLVIARDRDDLDALRHVHRLHHELGLKAEMIDGEAARELEPGLSPGVPGAVLCEDDHQVDPRRVVDALVEALRRRGVAIHSGVRVDEVLTEGERVVGIGAEGFDPPEDAVYVLATGAWARDVHGLEGDVPVVRPVRGQMIVVELGSPPLCRRVLRGPDAYLVPKGDGRLLIGATMEERGFDERPTAGGVMDLLVGAWEILPAIHDAPILDIWTGFRPVTLDNEPVMRRSQRFTNVIYALGHGRNGILLAPRSANVVADLALAALASAH